VGTVEGYILRKILEDTSPRLILYADKLAVREYVANTVGSEHLTSLITTFDSADEILWDILPTEFVMKCTHSSGGMIIVSKHGPKANGSIKLDNRNWGKYIIHPDDLDRVNTRKFFSKLLTQKYHSYTDYFEFAYCGIPPRIVVEELLTTEGGEIPSDFKFWCSLGEVICIQIDSNRFGHHLRDFYTQEWNRIDVSLSYQNSEIEVKPPPNLSKMIELAEKLSLSSDLIRVDLYDLKDRVLFGELTNYPGGGVEKFQPRSFSRQLYKRYFRKFS
jgi:hypothetical protein